LRFRIRSTYYQILYAGADSLRINLMPRCDGLPDGPCPRNVNNRSVRPSQGELMLCSTCESTRFPMMGKTAAQKKCTVTAPARSDATKVKATRSASASATVTNQQGDYIDDNDEDICPVCKDTVSQESVRCDICEHQIHSNCTGLYGAVLDKLLEIIQHTGWVCLDCRSARNQKIESLQSEMTYMSEKLADVMALVTTLQAKVDGSTVTQSSTPDTVITTTDVAMEVHKTLADVSRRKNNIVVTGIPESTTVTDERAFLSLCEEYFSFKPQLSQLGTRRLGKAAETSNQPRKLLVHLMSEEASTGILAEAKKLRKSSNTAVATSVYINPDRSPAEAKLAFEQRQKRRSSNQNRTKSNAPDATLSIAGTHRDQSAMNLDAPTIGSVRMTAAATSAETVQEDQPLINRTIGVNSDSGNDGSFFPA